MNQITKKRIPARRGVILLDTEFTAWPGTNAGGWAKKGEYRELIQLGAVALAGPDLAETGAFEALTRPRINTALSPYIQDLTGVTQARMAREGQDVAQGLAALARFAAGRPVLSYGHDGLVLLENLALAGIPFRAVSLADGRRLVPDLDKPARPAHGNAAMLRLPLYGTARLDALPALARGFHLEFQVDGVWHQLACHDIAPPLHRKQPLLKGVNSGRLAAVLGQPAPGAEHDALHDVRSLAVAIRLLRPGLPGRKPTAARPRS